MITANIGVYDDPRQIDLYAELTGTGLSQEKAKQLRRAITAYIDDNFERGKERTLYGNLPRAFTKDQLRLFFSKIQNDTHRACFLLQFFLGLRVGEICNVEFLVDQNLVKITNHKCRRVEYVPLYPTLEQFYLLYKPFFPLKLSNAYLAKKFRYYRSKHASLSYQYGESKTGMLLYQFTTHSLRHTAINFFRKSVRDPYIVSLFSRHKPRELGVMSTYYHTSNEELAQDLEKVFGEFRDIL